MDPQSGSIGFGVGGSNLTSRGSFELRRKGDLVLVKIEVTHVWSDDGYDFNKDAVFHDESQVLERHKKAKPFPWTAEWDELITGELLIVDSHSANPTRRRLGAEAESLTEDAYQ